MKRRTHKKEYLPPEYICGGCGVKRTWDKHPVRLGNTKERFCPICQKKTEHTRIN